MININDDCRKAITDLKRVSVQLDDIIERYQEISKLNIPTLTARRRKIERTIGLLKDEQRWIESIYNEIHKQCYGFEER